MSILPQASCYYSSFQKCMLGSKMTRYNIIRGSLSRNTWPLKSSRAWLNPVSHQLATQMSLRLGFACFHSIKKKIIYTTSHHCSKDWMEYSLWSVHRNTRHMLGAQQMLAHFLLPILERSDWLWRPRTSSEIATRQLKTYISSTEDCWLPQSSLPSQQRSLSN